MTPINHSLLPNQQFFLTVDQSFLNMWNAYLNLSQSRLSISNFDLQMVNEKDSKGNNFFFYFIEKYAEKPFVMTSEQQFLLYKIYTNFQYTVNNDGDTFFHLICKQKYWTSNSLNNFTLSPLNINLNDFADRLKEEFFYTNKIGKTPFDLLKENIEKHLLVENQPVSQTQFYAYLNLLTFFTKYCSSLKAQAIEILSNLIKKYPNMFQLHALKKVVMDNYYDKDIIKRERDGWIENLEYNTFTSAPREQTNKKLSDCLKFITIGKPAFVTVSNQEIEPFAIYCIKSPLFSKHILNLSQQKRANVTMLTTQYLTIEALYNLIPTTYRNPTTGDTVLHILFALDLGELFATFLNVKNIQHKIYFPLCQLTPTLAFKNQRGLTPVDVLLENFIKEFGEDTEKFVKFYIQHCDSIVNLFQILKNNYFQSDKSSQFLQLIEKADLLCLNKEVLSLKVNFNKLKLTFISSSRAEIACSNWMENFLNGSIHDCFVALQSQENLLFDSLSTPLSVRILYNLGKLPKENSLPSALKINLIKTILKKEIDLKKIDRWMEQANNHTFLHLLFDMPFDWLFNPPYNLLNSAHKSDIFFAIEKIDRKLFPIKDNQGLSAIDVLFMTAFLKNKEFKKILLNKSNLNAIELYATLLYEKGARSNPQFICQYYEHCKNLIKSDDETSLSELSTIFKFFTSLSNKEDIQEQHILLNPAINVNSRIVNHVEISSTSKINVDFEKPHALIHHLSRFNITQVHQLYSQLIAALMHIWTHTSIQSNLRRLISCAEGQKRLDLSLAINKDLQLDIKGISYILKPFYDFYKTYNKQNNAIDDLIGAIIQDAIESSGLCFSQKEQEALKVVLKQSFPGKELFSEFLIQQLILNDQEQQKLHDFKLTKKIMPIYFDPSSESLSFAVRDIVFSYLLKELKVRANYIEKISIKEASYIYQPAVLIFAVDNQSFLYPLSLIKGGPSQSIVGFGQDDTNQTTTRIIQSILPTFSCNIQPKDLNTIKEAYQANPSLFYLLSPPSDLETTHHELPPLEDSGFNRTPQIRQQNNPIAVKNVQASDPKPTFVSLNIQPAPYNKIISESPSNSYFHAPSSHPNNHQIPSDTLSALASVSGKEGNKKKRKHEHQELAKNKVQKIAEYESFKETHRSSKKGEAVAVSIQPNVEVSRSDYQADSISLEGDLLENLINGAFCQKALHRIDEIVSFSQLDTLEALLETTVHIRAMLNQDKRYVIEHFDDQQLKIYQKKAIQFQLDLANKGFGSLLGLAPGLGKTKSSCEVMRQLHKQSGRPCVVIAPNSLVPQWKETLIHEHFIVRKLYYSDLIEQFSNLSLKQQEQLAEMLTTFLMSHETEKEQQLQTKKVTGKKEKKKLKQHMEQKVQETLDSRIQDSFSLVEKSLQHPKLGLLVLMRLHQYAKVGALCETYRSLHLLDLTRLEGAKKLLTGPLTLLKGYFDSSLEKFIRAIPPYPQQRNTCKQFIFNLINYQETAAIKDLPLDASLCLSNIYQQVLTYTSDKRVTIAPDQYQTVVTTLSALYSLENTEEFCAIPWLSLTIDEAHEWCWDISKEKTPATKKQSSFIQGFIKDIYDRHKTHRFLLTGTPQVNTKYDPLSLLQLANPQHDFYQLAQLINNREVLLNKALVIQLKKAGSALNKALLDYFLAFEHMRQLQNELIIKYDFNDAQVKLDWTVDGIIRLPRSEKIDVELDLTQEQLQAFNTVKDTNLFSKQEKSDSILFHPALLKKGNDKKMQEAAKEMVKKWKTKKDVEPFIAQSGLLKYLFAKQGILETAIENKKPILFFLSQIRFGIILKKILKIYFKSIRTKLYNGSVDPDIRADIVKQFEDKNSNVKAIVLTPDAGGVGLNLRLAELVFNLSPWWHSAMAEQIEARATRVNDTTVKQMYRLSYKTVTEFHKDYVANVKDLWKEVSNTQDTDQLLAILIEALSSDGLKISMKMNDQNLVQEQIELNKAQMKAALEACLSTVRAHINSYIQAVDIHLVDDTNQPSDAPPKDVIAELQGMTITAHTDKMENDAPQDVTAELQDMTITANPDKMEIETQEIYVPSKLTIENTPFQLVPFSAKNKKEAVGIANYWMQPSAAKEIPIILGQLNRCTDTQWHELLQKPETLVHPTFLNHFLKTFSEKNLVARWMQFDSKQQLIYKDPKSKNYPAPRLLQLDDSRYALLIKLIN